MKRLAFIVVAGLLAGCGASWKVVKQAPAEQLKGKSSVALATDFSKVTIDEKNEEAHTAAMSADDKRAWEDVKKGIDEEIANAVKANAKGYAVGVGGLAVKTVVEHLNPGCPTGFCHSQLIARVFITTPDGTLLDEITVENTHGGSVFEATTERRLRNDARAVGEGIAEYLNGRVK
jgi:hypothetical protein